MKTYPKKIRQKSPRSRQKRKEELLSGELIKSYAYGTQFGRAAPSYSTDLVHIVIDDDRSLETDGRVSARDGHPVIYTIYNGTTFT